MKHHRNHLSLATISLSAVSVASVVAIGMFGGAGAATAASTPSPPTASSTLSPTAPARSGTALPPAAASLTAAEKADLAFSRDEERMARDLYQLFANTYDQARPFSNIVRSEQQHFDVLGSMLVRYGVADPAAGKPAGQYANAEIQKLYDAWAAKGKTSLTAAYAVGVELEKADIADLKEILTRTSAADLKVVYTNLLKGSENHLRAYTAASQGTTGGKQQGQQGQGRWGQQGQRQGKGGQQRMSGQQGGQGQGGGYGRTGQRPADCPVTSAT
ncbi:MAG: DUF2202 domain-containing protein [Austwickia sp.]|nr:DUF2202 domain-containing protein [Austwickia sp.]MBK8437131.1 DUF2202 domain-containing protein [Austwickia sp.]MBK9102365.1 DUF2202 domain-containing protein [Austwickia sp.]